MKTLEEVIELCEKALWCAYLPQDDTTTTAGLALHYLREYREMKEHLACLDAVALHGEDTQRVNNPALTWDELLKMEGKPVWVEGTNYTRWAIITGIYDGEIIRFEGYKLYASESKDDIGLSWQAYRMERKCQ